MQPPDLIYLSAANKPEGIDRLVAVRPDTVICVERSRLEAQPPKPPMRQVALPQQSIEVTTVVLSIGIQINVAEPVREVVERVNEALEKARPRRWWRR